MARREEVTFDEMVEATKLPGDEGLGEVARLAKLQIEYEDELKAAEEAVQKVKQKLAQIQADALPHAMAKVGLKTFELEDGTQIKVEPFVSTHIAEERREKAFQWLAEHGYGDLVKDTVVLTFGRQEHSRAVEAMKYLLDAGYNPSNKQSVHGQTLKAWARAELAKGTDVPHDLFGIYTGQKAKIRRSVA